MIRQILESLRLQWLDFWHVPFQAVAAILLAIAGLIAVAVVRTNFSFDWVDTPQLAADLVVGVHTL